MKAAKIVVFDARTQVYPADSLEDVWHVYHDGKPVVEIQFTPGPMDADKPCLAVIQDSPDYVILAPPEGHEQVFEDRRERP